MAVDHTWCPSSIKEVALKCTSRSDFRAKYSGAYKAAKRLGIYDEVVEHLPVKNKINWTPSKLKEEAAKYTTRGHFYAGSNRAYKVALATGFMDCICCHMIDPIKVNKQNRINISKEEIYLKAKEFNYRSDFRIKAPAYYDAAHSLGIYDNVCENMTAGRWTKEDVLRIAAQYSTRTEFRVNHSGVYKAAIRLDILDLACNHMVTPNIGLLPTYVYFVEITHKTLPTTWKVGITNKDNIGARFHSECSDGTSLKVLSSIKCTDRKEALKVEATILSRYKKFKYDGPSPLKNTGVTEMFTQNLLELEEVSGGK